MRKSGDRCSGNMGCEGAACNGGTPCKPYRARQRPQRRFPSGPPARPMLALDLDDILRRIEERLADLEVEESEEDEDF